MPATTDPMRVLQARVAMLGMYDPDATDNSRAGQPAQGGAAHRQFATAICAHHRVRQRPGAGAAGPGLSHAANFLYMLTGERPTAATTKAFDACLTLYAEHELNASTFTTRVIAATLSDMHSAVAGGVGRAQGPAPRRRRRGGDAHAAGDRPARQRRAFVERALAREAAPHGLRPPRLHARAIRAPRS